MLQGMIAVLKELKWFEVLLLAGILVLIGWTASRLKNPMPIVPVSLWFRGGVLLGLVVLNALIISWMSRPPMNSVDVVRNGIIDFELAKTEQKAGAIRTAWLAEENAVEFPAGSGKMASLAAIAQRNIYIDFLFIPSYVLLLSFACFWIAENIRWDVLSQVGTVIGWGIVVAGVLDIVENLAMLGMLANGPTPLLAALSFWCAVPKFVILLGFAGAFILVGLVTLMVQGFVMRLSNRLRP